MTEERPRADLGEDRDPATPTCRPAIRQRLPVRRHLPMGAKGAALCSPSPTRAPCRCISTRSAATSLQRAHGVVLMDRAGWHSTDKLKVPKNLTTILLPSRSPELNPVENIWRYLRQNWLSNRVFEDYDAIFEAGCQAWNKLINQPQTIMSIGSREWAHKGR